MERGYESAVWMTYRQAQELSGQVRAGEKLGSPHSYLCDCNEDIADPKISADLTRRLGMGQ